MHKLQLETFIKKLVTTKKFLSETFGKTSKTKSFFKKNSSIDQLTEAI